MTCAPPRPSPAPVSVSTSKPFSVTIRLKTSPTERTPSPGFQSYFPAMTRARPANLSDSVPASFDRAVCVVCARSGATLCTVAIATAHAIVPVRIVRIDISPALGCSDCCVVPRSCSYRLHEKPRADIGGAPPFMTENRQFHSFIMITMILTARHDSAIDGKRLFGVLQEEGSSCSMIYAPWWSLPGLG